MLHSIIKKSGFITKHKKALLSGFILFFAAAFVILFNALFPAFGITWDNQFINTLFHIRYHIKGKEEVNHLLAPVNLFDSTLYKLNTAASRRALYAEVIRKLKALNVSSITCDISFQDPYLYTALKTDNALLTRALQEAGNVYLPVILLTKEYSQVAGYSGSEFQDSTLLKENTWHPEEKGKGQPFTAFFYFLSSPDFNQAARGLGHINYEPDSDGIIRRFPLLYKFEDGYIPALSLRVICDYLHVTPGQIQIHWGKWLLLKQAQFPYGPVKDIFIPIDNRGRIFINWVGPLTDTFHQYSFDDFIGSTALNTNSGLLADQFENNLVILSDVSTYNKDFGSTVFDKVYPLGNVHTTIANSILTDNFLAELPPSGYLAISLVLAVLLVFAALKFKPPVFFLFTLFLYIGYLGGSTALFLYGRMLPRVSLHTLWLVLCLISIILYRFSVTDKEKALLLLEEQANRRIKLKNRQLRSGKKQLELYSRKLKQAVRYRTLFFENITHEFRTPLTLILGPLNQLLSSAAALMEPDRIKKELEMAVRNCGRLLHLINQLLALSKSRAGAPDLKVYPVDLVSFTGKILADYLPYAQTKEIEIRFNPAFPSFVCYVDKEKLEIILNNLLSNAVKFSGSRKTVVIRLFEQPVPVPGGSTRNKSRTGMIGIAIKDAGPGIPPEELPHIFKRFYQGPHTREQGTGGTGIGLYLVKKYVERHHGFIRVENSAGGAEFIVYLPVNKNAYTEAELGRGVPENAARAPAQVPDPTVHSVPALQPGIPVNPPTVGIDAAGDLLPKKLYKESILVIEDDAEMREYIKDVLEAEYTIHEAHNGKAGWQAVQAAGPDLIITDWMLPGMNGNALLQKLKKDKKTAGIPVILITAKADWGVRTGTQEIQPDDFLSKPFHPAELKTRVHNLLQLSSTTRQVTAYQEEQVLTGNRRTQVRTIVSTIKTEPYPEEPLLVIDDEAEILEYYRTVFRESGITNVLYCRESSRALTLLKENICSVLILDLYMPGITGRELMEQVAEEHPGIPVIVVTGLKTIESAVACLKAGAFDYLLKPVDVHRLITVIGKALEMNAMRTEIRALRGKLFSQSLVHPENFSGIITNNSRMLTIFQYIEAIAPAQKPVLITGESGVGKEMIARAVHRACGLKGAFVPVNAAGLDDVMFSDTLFGHRKAAFTGAQAEREGLIKKAAQGTLFLDEIGELEPASQVKLLRLLQESEYYALGSDQVEISSARIITATNIDLTAALEQKKFRNDLYYRLAVHHIEIPPLRERLHDDLPLLVEYFLSTAAAALHKKKPTAPPELITLLKTYAFPGNIRELQLMIFDAVSRHKEKKLSLAYFKEYIKKQAGIKTITQPAAGSKTPRFAYTGNFPTLDEVEDYLIEQAMEKANGNQSVAAHLLGISSSTLSRRFKKST